jgi:predicted O-methyltransferase YrrM
VVSTLRSRHVGALVRLRAAHGQHTDRESNALAHHATGRRALVEIGVAEGVSASRLRSAMHTDGCLWLIDPYPSRWPVPPAYLVAKRSVRRQANGGVVWVRSRSQDVAATWRTPIDFLFIDGDHSEDSCERDWLDWSPWIMPGGVVAFHDSAPGPTSPTRADDGPALVVNRYFIDPRSREVGWSIIDVVDSITFVGRDKADAG